MNGLYTEAIIQNNNIHNVILDFMSFEGDKYIYGNSLQTAVAIGLMRSLDIEMAGLILPQGMEITERKGFWKQMMKSLKVVNVASVKDKEASYILIADSQNDFQNNYEQLYSYGFRKLVGCCWKHNSDMMDITCKYYYEKLKGSNVCIETD